MILSGVMVRDVRDLEMSGSDGQAMGLYEKALIDTLSYHGDPIGHAKEALRIDPTFVSARLLQAHILAFSLNAPFWGAAERALLAIREGAAKPDEREILHMQAIQAWLDGDPGKASDVLGIVTERWPQDLMALFFGHQADFFAAREDLLISRLERALPGWTSDMPGYGYLLGMRAFGLEEAGKFEQAEALAHEAVALDRRDAWAIHAMAHIYEMQGRVEDGIAWYADREADWAEDCFFAVHNWWHRALYHLDLEDYDETLGIYDRGLAPDAKSLSLNLSDAVALLWRLNLRNIASGDRWTTLADAFERHGDKSVHVFNDVHAGLAFIGAGRPEMLCEHLKKLKRIAAGSSGHGAMLAKFGIPFIEAASLLESDPSSAAEKLEALMPMEHLLTGSRAQRDLLPLTFIEASLRSGRVLKAGTLLKTRLKARPESHWIARDLGRC